MAKHIIEENIKTIGGQSIVGKGDIEISSGEVKVDNKTITKNKQGELQLGVLNEELATELDLEDYLLRMVYNGGETHTTFSQGAIVLMDNGSSLGITSGSLFIDDEYGGGRLQPNLVSLHNREGGVNFTTDTIELFDGTSLKYPKKTGENTLVISVNDIQADENGNITLPSEEGKTDNKTISKNKDGELQLGVFNESFGTNIVDGTITSNVGFNVNDKYGGSVIINPTFLEGAVRPDNGDSFDYRLTSSGFTFRSTSAGYNQSVEVGETGIGYYSNNWNEENETFEGILKYPNLSSKSRVITASVNGVFADENGNITIPSEEGKTDNKTISLNENGVIQLGNIEGVIESSIITNDSVQIKSEDFNLKINNRGIESTKYLNNYFRIGFDGVVLMSEERQGINETRIDPFNGVLVTRANGDTAGVDFTCIKGKDVVVEFPKNAGGFTMIKAVNNILADENGNITLPSNEDSFSNQFLTNAGGEKFIGIDGGDAYGQIAGLALKEFAGGTAKGVVIGNPKMLDGDYQGVISYFGDQENMQILNTMVTHVDNENNVISKGRTSVTSDSIGCDSGFNSEFKNGVFGLGGTIAESSFSSYTTKDESRATLTSQFKKGADVRASARIDANSTEETSKILTESESFEITDTKPGGKTYDVFEIFKLVENQALEIADLKQRIEALEQ